MDDVSVTEVVPRYRDGFPFPTTNNFELIEVPIYDHTPRHGIEID